jgi:hypothetical protein
MPLKSRLAKATWWTTPESGFCGSGVGDMSHQMHHRAAVAIHPCSRKTEIGPFAVLEAKNVLVEPDRGVELPGSDVEMVEHAYAHATSLPLP